MWRNVVDLGLVASKTKQTTTIIHCSIIHWSLMIVSGMASFCLLTVFEVSNISRMDNG